jgi:hypothetical protein
MAFTIKENKVESKFEFGECQLVEFETFAKGEQGRKVWKLAILLYTNGTETVSLFTLPSLPDNSWRQSTYTHSTTRLPPLRSASAKSIQHLEKQSLVHWFDDKGLNSDNTLVSLFRFVVKNKWIDPITSINRPFANWR